MKTLTPNEMADQLVQAGAMIRAMQRENDLLIEAGRILLMLTGDSQPADQCIWRDLRQTAKTIIKNANGGDL